jgi:hypothetical protein
LQFNKLIKRIVFNIIHWPLMSLFITLNGER